MFHGLKNVVDNFVSDTKNEEKRAQLYSILMYIYNEEFNDSLQNLLKEKPNQFINDFKLKMINLLFDIISNKLVSNELTNLLTHVEDKIDEIYKNAYLLCKDELSKIENNNIKNFDLSFMKHCINDETNKSIHSCGGNFYPIYQKNPYDNSLILKYVICSQCKDVYHSSYILMKCPICETDYYSYYVSKYDMENPPATWEKYHCDIIMNEKMCCIRCGEPFCLNKKGLLLCKNCNLLVRPLDVFWKCVKCLKEFTSNAKIYNPLEFKSFKNAVKDAIINKKIVHPQKLNCGCELIKNKMDNAKFRHLSSNCDGEIYLGYLDKKNILVCGVCGTFCSVKKFIWNCPFCKKNFKCKEIDIIEGKNIINKLMKRNSISYLEKKNDISTESTNYSTNNTNYRRRFLSIDLRPKDGKQDFNDDNGILSHNVLKNVPLDFKKFNFLPPKNINQPKILLKRASDFFNKENMEKNTEKIIKMFGKKQNEKINNKEEEDKTNNEKKTIDDELLLLKESDLGEFIYISENISEVIYNNISFSFIDLDKFDDNIYKKFYALYKSDIKFQKDQIKIYNLFQNKFLTEQIFSILTDDFKEASKPFNQNEISSILINSIIPLKFYVDNFDKNFLISTNNFIKCKNGEYKFFPFINGIGEQYESNNNNCIIALIMIDMITLDEKVVMSIQKLFNEKNNNELIKLLNQILRGKLSDGIVSILVKMLETDEKLRLTLDQLVEMIKE